jgi:hypothetical protein
MRRLVKINPFPTNERPEIAAIVDVPGLAGRTIVGASAWSDGDSLTIELDDGALFHVSPCTNALRWRLERPPETEGASVE